MNPVAPICKNCKFLWPAGTSEFECRRFPPSVNPNLHAPGWFPAVYATWWCGEYQQKKEGRS